MYTECRRNSLISGKGLNNYSGFGDVIFLSEAFYTASMMLGLTPIYCPLEANRSGTGIFDQLGVNQSFQRRLDSVTFGENDVVIITLPNLQSDNDLTSWLRLTRQNVAELSENSLVRFEFAGERKMCAIAFLNEALNSVGTIPTYRDFFDLPSSFRVECHHKSLFRGFRPRKVLLHVRRGDIGLFPIPGAGTFTPWGIDGIIRPSIVRDNADLSQPHVSDREYLRLMENLLLGWGDLAEIVVVSDGHSRGANILSQSVHSGLLTKDQADELPQIADELDQLMSSFYQANLGAKCYIGEDCPSMVDICASAVDADVVVSLSGGFLASALRYFKPQETGALVVFNGISRRILTAGNNNQATSVIGVDPRNIDNYLAEIRTAGAKYFSLK